LGDKKMIRYIIDGDNAGKILKWETMVIGGISAPVMGGFAKAMIPVIDNDMQEFTSKRVKIQGVARFEEEYGKCDMGRITVYPSGKYIAISYSLRINRISAKDIENLQDMGFINIPGK
jgi:hypothetical protein